MAGTTTARAYPPPIYATREVILCTLRSLGTSVSVTGVIPDDHGRILLICRRDNQHWEPPGCVLYLLRKYRLTDCAARSGEATGLDIPAFHAHRRLQEHAPRQVIALVFRCKITGGYLTANDEVTAFHWADEADIRQLTSEAYAVRVLDALSGYYPAAVRHHDGANLMAADTERGSPSYATRAVVAQGHPDRPYPRQRPGSLRP